MKKPHAGIRIPVGLLLHIPSVFFALAYFSRITSLFPHFGAKVFLTESFNILLSVLFGAIGVSIIRWKLPWK